MSRKGYPSDKQDQFVLRLPDGMRDLIKASASESGRSMNQEIVDALNEFFPVPPSEEDILYELKRLEHLVNDIENGGKRYEIHSSLQDLAEKLTKVGKRMDPAVLLPSKIMSRIEALAEEHGTDRDRMAKYLVVMGIEAMSQNDGNVSFPPWSRDELF